ncbi:mycofactocin-coupled SDR family oxidoreductase [Actinoplanes sp. NPDC051343]|uniref:mycofactocin-coupled SDR family oxidoreductase n=1 Tax=Actinoplanes sp. NPDC051343 TaxID=3363906 RepID=UPI00379E6CC9
MGRVSGKVALVTGAGRGQGRSHAIRLAEQGASVVAIDICAPIDSIAYPMATLEDLRETEQLVRDLGSEIITVTTDIRDRQKLKSGIDDAVQRLGGLDIVVANAGVAALGKWDSFTEQQWDAVVSVNLTGTWNTVTVAVPHLIKRGGGSVIVTSSAAGLVGLPYLLPYVASKHAIVGLVRALSNELADENVRVNAICPTGVSGTGLAKDLDPTLIDSNERLKTAWLNAMQVELISPLDVSNAVLYLASDESRYVTGIAMSVDAGMVNL